MELIMKTGWLTVKLFYIGKNKLTILSIILYKLCKIPFHTHSTPIVASQKECSINIVEKHFRIKK